MPDVDALDLSPGAIREGLTDGRLTVAQVAEAFIDRYEAGDYRLQAFLHFDPELVRDQAVALDRELRDGRPRTPLTGVPVALKDNLCTRDAPTTCGSKILEGYRPPYDATVIERLRAAGALVWGKTNLDEFAMGSSTENSAFFPTRNPWDRARVPGGSSGGSAAAVAAGLVPLALGSDTGGSIRQPAALCGIVGFKPTYGAVSRYGLVAFASSLDQIGPLGRTVRDVADLFFTIAGPDPRDSTCLTEHWAAPEWDRSVTGLRFGVPAEYTGEGLEPTMARELDRARAAFLDLGATEVAVSLPHTACAIPTYYLIAPAEASANLARYDGVRYGFRAAEAATLKDQYRHTRGRGFGAEVKRRIMLGTYALSAGYYDAYYGKAQEVRTLLTRDFRRAFEEVDVLLTPTTPTGAFTLGEKADDPLSMYLSDIFTVTANLAGIPAISLPCGCNPEGLPLGVQLMGPHHSDPALLRIAAHLEGALGFSARPAA